VGSIESLLQLHVVDRPRNLELVESHTKMPPSPISPPKLELKPLLENLKHAYLGDDETLPVMISNALTYEQEDRLIRVLREHSEALGSTLVDLKGISPTICSHKIALELHGKPKSVPQRRLNPPMMDVVQKEILKCLVLQ